MDHDMLKEGMKNYMNSMARVYLYKFIARYVRKVHPDSIITQDLSENVGVSFINMITPRCGASLGGTLDYIPNPTLRLKNEEFSL